MSTATETIDATAKATRGHYLWLTAIVAVAFALRGALGLLHPFMFPDSYDYSALAHAIAAGRRYEVHNLFASRLPGYPVLLAGIYLVSDFSRWAVMVFQAACGSATVLVTYFVARRLMPRSALLAAAIAALDPLSIAFSAALLTEIPFTLLLMLAVLLLLRLLEDASRWLDWLLLGLCWAAATYVRGEVVLCLLPLVAWLWWHQPDSVRIARLRRGTAQMALSAAGPLLSLLVVFVCLMPWWVRNYSLFHQDFFRLSTLQGISLYESVYHGATGGPRQSHIPLPKSMVHLNESQRDLAWTHKAWHSIVDHPLRVLRLAVVKMGRTWSPWLHATGYRNVWLNVLLGAWSVALFALAMLGLLRHQASWRLVGVPVIIILYFTLMHALFLGSVRYRVELLPLVAVFAAMGLTPVWKRLDAARTPQAT
ncbi:MAG: phospholipid carrier-dependent glycosyltransferase [Phycisphaerales bacterium]|nr:phospholipid carrier-dependent glycosyltransferase [Phycisphaerales bacterium]